MFAIGAQPEPSQPWVVAEPQAAISMCEPLPPTVDPAFGADIEGLPCRSFDADLWFGETPAELEQAKTHCAECPVRAGCLAGALDRREPWGVWGGEIFSQGTVIERKRPRGRPRKTVVAA
ncbi:WhiB family transcriptional regulator [Jatrophihabitans sp. DSM 44399]|uniref:Transcriptional regulator WhiB n=2 Tax=Jatrophihabitans lederbergiae TaxID=3075547 RepID=A0ABU2J745_9ACTN|nr:WhiB family transcriptional regulator [Jatrophihabitans sp. DSM 44399]MDT0260556.1 WhiB family transcriptional regulator [Jatrophihabitans sp. DSM 44399]